jgi:tripartite-type tricarboxylate transporter receptor subunit TctC
MKRRDAIKALAVALAAIPAAGAFAQTWPARPVRLLLSQPAGSGPDNIARLLGDRLAKSWGQAVVIENRPGGQNTIGAQAAARSAADGYAYYFATTAALVTNGLLFKELSYDPQKDFAPVAFIGRSPFGLVVNADSPWRTLDEFIAACKAAPGKVTLGNEGPRTFGGMTAQLLALRAKASANLVPFVSATVMAQDLMGKHVDAIVADLASTAPLIRQGRLRVLATTAGSRLPDWPDVPAVAERLPGFDMVGWFAIVAPTGTPNEAVQRVNKDVNTLLADREVAAHIATVGPIAEPGYDPQRVAAFLQQERDKWTGIVKELGIQPE